MQLAGGNHIHDQNEGESFCDAVLFWGPVGQCLEEGILEHAAAGCPLHDSRSPSRTHNGGHVMSSSYLRDTCLLRSAYCIVYVMHAAHCVAIFYPSHLSKTSEMDKL